MINDNALAYSTQIQMKVCTKILTNRHMILKLLCSIEHLIGSWPITQWQIIKMEIYVIVSAGHWQAFGLSVIVFGKLLYYTVPYSEPLQPISKASMQLEFTASYMCHRQHLIFFNYLQIISFEFIIMVSVFICSASSHLYIIWWNFFI